VAKLKAGAPRARPEALPQWIKPQLTKLVDEPPEGRDWLHEIKFDGYRIHARLDRGSVRLLTRTGLDWTHKYPAIASAVPALGAKQAYVDGELCGVRADGTTSFSIIQAASDAGNADALVFYLFDLLYPDGQALGPAPLRERKERLRDLLSEASAPLQYSDHQLGRGPEFYEKACELSLEGIVSKRVDAPYAPGNRGLWVKVKCLNREEFLVVGWTDPEGARPWLGSLLLAYYDPEGRLVYAGRAGVGINDAELGRLWRRLRPLATSEMPLDIPPPRTSRFGSPLILGRVHWVRPSWVAEVKFLTWTDENLLRQVVHDGLREDKPAAEVRRPVPHPKAAPPPRQRLPAERHRSKRLPVPPETFFSSCRTPLCRHAKSLPLIGRPSPTMRSSISAGAR
jgi:bifunctional non-homologous end joining protein LigD